MKIFLLSVFAVTAAVLLATGRAAPKEEAPVAAAATADGEPAGVMPSGPLLPSLTPEAGEYDPVAVPEPVWASVLAACAVSLLRRGRSY